MMHFRAGMFVYAFAFMLGILIVQRLTRLPDLHGVWQLFILLLLPVILYRVVCRGKKLQCLRPVSNSYVALTLVLLLLILIGFLYSLYRADRELAGRLPESLTGKNIIVEGMVSGIPEHNGTVRRFEFLVSGFQFEDSENKSNKSARLKTLERHPKKIRLSWYYGKEVNAGEHWQLQLRLKPPHGFMNPGGFDYESWLFQHGIHATGYVRKSSINQRLQTASSWSVDRLRQNISQLLASLSEQGADVETYSLVKALAIGDKSSISNQQWQVLTSTGTSHLMAISGLHIGLASLFAYVLVRRIPSITLIKRIPAQHTALIAGFIVAFLYALLAGLSIPTQRAIIMLFAITMVMLLRRNTRPLDTLGFALLLVLVADPLAVMSAGFWFSFSAVTVIFISLMSQQNSAEKTAGWVQKIRSVGWQWIRLQLIISIFLLPLSLYMFQQGSLISPLANLLLIPYVSFLVVPVVLLALLFSFIYLDLAKLLFSLAAYLLDLIWPILVNLSALPMALWQQGNVSLSDVILATLAILIVFFSQPLTELLKRRYLAADNRNRFKLLWLIRVMAILFTIPIFLPDNDHYLIRKNGEFQATVLDVGQGSSMVIRTSNHLVIFDAGAKFSDKLNAGSGVVVPYLRSEGIASPDLLIISHGDADHIGGAQVLLDSYPGIGLYGQGIEELRMQSSEIKKQQCTAGQKWQWDGVDFAFLSPEKSSGSSSLKHRNNRSCVLRVSSVMGSILVTGDIEGQTERKLLNKYGESLSSDVLMVPHHGSNTSSSLSFISAVNPKFAVISAAYKNRYRLPSKKVLDRYKTMDKEILQTADSGAISMYFLKEDKHEPLFTRYRELARRYWHHQPELKCVSAEICKN